MTSNNWFTEARYGLYSLLERAEWVWNREEIPLEKYKQLAARFTAKYFDADKLCRMAVDAGMRYVVLTTMHHEGFRLYPTALSDFHIGNSGAAGRDLVAETIAAARHARGDRQCARNRRDRPLARAENRVRRRSHRLSNRRTPHPAGPPSAL